MINMFLLNLFLSAVYMLLTDDFSFFNFLIGFAIGYIVVTLYAQAAGKASYSVKLFRLLKFVCYFLYILTKANLQVAWEIITPGYQMTPRIIRYPVEGMTRVQITTLANAITLTPGTLSADVDEDGKYLYVHCMYAKERQNAVADIDELRNRIMREVFGK